MRNHWLQIQTHQSPSNPIQCFNLFDLNNDGFIDASDLRGTFQTMGMQVDDEQIKIMLADGSQPMNFDSFALMMCEYVERQRNSFN